VSAEPLTKEQAHILVVVFDMQYELDLYKALHGHQPRPSKVVLAMEAIVAIAEQP
jgi:hypothetical protein